MTQEDYKAHPITPSPELVKQWWKEAQKSNNPDIVCWVNYVATQAARWGADQELEACVEWTRRDSSEEDAVALRAARRPKPQSLKEQALEAFEKCWNDGYLKANQADVIRRALEQLDD